MHYACISACMHVHTLAHMCKHDSNLFKLKKESLKANDPSEKSYANRRKTENYTHTQQKEKLEIYKKKIDIRKIAKIQTLVL